MVLDRVGSDGYKIYVLALLKILRRYLLFPIKIFQDV